MTPLEQHRLVSNHDSGFYQSPQRRLGFSSQLAGVFKMGIEVERSISLQHPNQPGGDSLREYAGYSTSDADDLYMLNGSKSSEDLLQDGVREGQRVTAGDHHVSNLRVLLDVLDRLVSLVAADAFVGQPHLALAGAEPAVHGTLGCDQEEDSVGVSVNQTRDRAHGLFLQRVAASGPVVSLLRHVRNGLFPNWVPRFLDKAQVVGIDAHRVLLCDVSNLFSIHAGKASGQSFRGPNRTRKQALPKLHQLLPPSPVSQGFYVKHLVVVIRVKVWDSAFITKAMSLVEVPGRLVLRAA